MARVNARCLNALVLVLLTACIDLSVYGPYDDYSTMPNDFISKSIKRNLRVGEPFGDKAMAQDAYARFSATGFNLDSIRRDLESADALCSLEDKVLRCGADRRWRIVWPKPTRDMDGTLRVDRTQEVHAHISYQITGGGDDGHPSVQVDIKYSDRKGLPGSVWPPSVESRPP